MDTQCIRTQYFIFSGFDEVEFSANKIMKNVKKKKSILAVKRAFKKINEKWNENKMAIDEYK